MKGALKFRFFRAVVKAIVHLYYRSVEIYGRSFIPKNGRTLFLANHQAGLIDGLLLVGTNRFTVRALAKNTLWDNVIMRPFLNGLAMIPVFRKQDLTGAKANQSVEERNRLMYDTVGESFRSGEYTLLFPEGRSHDEPYMLRLRSGGARILLQTEANHDFRLGLKWMPVTLDFEAKDLPGTRVLVHYHPPRSIAHLRDLYRRDPEAAIEKLRAEMEDYLRETTINFATWSDRIFIERLTEVWLARSPAHLLLDRHNHLIKWKRIMEKTSAEDKELWEALRESLRKLYGQLTILNLQPGEIYRRSDRRRQQLLTKVLMRIFLWSPLILTGIAFWKLPTMLVQFVARKGATSKDVIPSYQIVAAVVAYPLWLLIVFPWAVAFTDQSAAWGLLILEIASGVAVLTVSRVLRPQIRNVIGLYRYGSLDKLITETQGKIEDICHQAARLWNRGLRRQVVIEETTTDDTEKKAS